MEGQPCAKQTLGTEYPVLEDSDSKTDKLEDRYVTARSS